MLTAAHRLRVSAEFSRTTKKGFRAAQSCLVVHFFRPQGASGPAKVGFTVSATVGGSVVRHQVTRRLRAAAGQVVAELPEGSQWVVRALPPAAGATSEQLVAELNAAIRGAVAKSNTEGTG